jgi:hypothetical protein
VSIFKKLGKLVGKVGKLGLGVVTHGVSDKVLNALKAMNAQKKRNALLTRAAEAVAIRHAPETKSTTRYARAALITATRAAGSMGNSRDRTDIDAGNALPGSGGTRTVRRARKSGMVQPRSSRRRRKAPLPVLKRKPARKARGGAKRAAPAAFAQFAAKAKALAAEWRAAGGKEGTGQTFFEWKRGK